LNRNVILFVIAIVCGLGLIGYTLTVDYYQGALIASLLVFAIWIVFYLAVFYRKTSQNNEGQNTVAALEQKLAEFSHQMIDLQDQLVAQEKMASIGALTAGIAHEIKNPLNFVNNFSDMTVELIQELKEELQKLPDTTPKETIESMQGLLEEIATSCQKINEHGKRAESIIRNMLIQSRNVEDEKTPCNVNSLLDEYYNLAYHGMRAQNNKFNAKVEKHFDSNLPEILVSPQSMGRVFLNIINNGLYAANEKAEKLGTGHNGFMPTITITTLQDEDNVIVKIQDNGNGIPDELRQKIFEPFFTTKPAGKGTGLGLPICYDIVVKEHGGKLDILSVPNEFTEFILLLPKNNA
jgi:two-component system NtrC family sensor kinase